MAEKPQPTLSSLIMDILPKDNTTHSVSPLPGQSEADWKDALAHLPYELAAALIPGFSPNDFDAMVEKADQSDWDAYGRLALRWGAFSPIREDPPEIHVVDAESARRALSQDNEGPADALTIAFYRQKQGPPAWAWLDSLLAWSPTLLRQLVLDYWFVEECHGHDWTTRCHGPELALHLMKRGAAITAETGSMATGAGDSYLLEAMLRNGLDPNAKPDGEMPLLINALHKNRARSSQNMMRCAALLWQAGADTSRWFENGTKPSCLLELHEMANGHGGDLPENHWGHGFFLNWNYFDESGMDIQSLLPPQGEHEARSRVATLFAPIDPRQMQPWLVAALEVCAMDIESKTPLTTTPSSKKKAL